MGNVIELKYHQKYEEKRVQLTKESHKCYALFHRKYEEIIDALSLKQYSKLGWPSSYQVRLDKIKTITKSKKTHSLIKEAEELLNNWNRLDKHIS